MTRRKTIYFLKNATTHRESDRKLCETLDVHLCNSIYVVSFESHETPNLHKMDTNPNAALLSALTPGDL